MKLRVFSLLAAATFVGCALWPTAASAEAAGTRQLFLGLAKGTTTVDLVSGAGSTDFNGVALPVGRFSAATSVTFALNGTTLTSSGTGTLSSGSGQLFFNTSTTGTLTGGTVATATTTDTITGGTGHFTGASGSLTIYAKSTASSTLGNTETFQVITFWIGNINY
jgi:hypothetical protein